MKYLVLLILVMFSSVNAEASLLRTILKRLDVEDFVTQSNRVAQRTAKHTLKPKTCDNVTFKKEITAKEKAEICKQASLRTT